MTQTREAHLVPKHVNLFVFDLWLGCCWHGAQTEEGEIASSMRSEDRLCSALQTRIAECQSVLQQLLAVEQECQQHATRQAAEHHGRAQDMTTLEKKSIQYKQVR